MKKILTILMIVSALTVTPNIAQGQAWTKDTKILVLDFGISQFYHMDNYYYGNVKNHSWYSPTTLQLNFQGEFGIHKYVGLGFTTGIGGRRGWNNGYSGEVNIPIGMIANFHFYQLIADKSGKNIHADKLDIYVGAEMGSGLAFTFYNYTSTVRVVPLAFGGIHAGIRYYFTPKVGVSCELGWGKSFANVGFAFKL